MNKKIITLLILTLNIYANCSNSNRFWTNKLADSKSLEQFFIDNYSCKREFYKSLNSVQKIYFDTVLYPYGLTKRQYINRWLAIVYNDKSFFKKFRFFNNYFATHKNNITTHQLNCFQKRRGFKEYINKEIFYRELSKRGMINNVSYLYPLIRWSYQNSGIDMRLSAKRVEAGERTFGIKRGKIGNSEQFARYIALFNREYSEVAIELSKNSTISKLDAYKLLVILTYLESRGNIFATSSTGAFGPLQLTMHYYMMYGEPNNPFNPKSSIIKLANKFVYYNKIGKSLDASVIAYKSGSLTKCQDEVNSQDVDCRYYNDFKRYMYGMEGLTRHSDISKYLTGKSYISKKLDSLKRARNPDGLKYYEPYQYAVLKGGVLRDRALNSIYMSGEVFKSLGKMKRSDIYYLQNRYGANKIGVISDKKVCY